MKYLIDGYNLLHALVLVNTRAGPGGLQKARGALLKLLRGALAEEALFTTVVFDADRAPAGLPAEDNYEGIKVLFAIHEPHADDLIEDIIRSEARPGQLVVVSDDHRLQRAGAHRNCQVLGCAEFLDRLAKPGKASKPRAPEQSVKPEGMSHEQVQDWLKEFQHLHNDPNLKALSEPREWEDIDSSQL